MFARASLLVKHTIANKLAFVKGAGWRFWEPFTQGGELYPSPLSTTATSKSDSLSACVRKNRSCPIYGARPDKSGNYRYIPLLL